MDNGYAYDAVSNVLSVTNKAALPESGKAGGQMAHAYTYDALYRLASATETYAGADSKTASYRLEMSYDNMHRIVSKKQHLTQQGVQFDGTLHVGYDLAYHALTPWLGRRAFGVCQDLIGGEALASYQSLYLTSGTPQAAPKCLSGSTSYLRV